MKNINLENTNKEIVQQIVALREELKNSKKGI